VQQSLGLMMKIGQPECSARLTEVRAMLEPEIAALAALRTRESDLVRMRKAIAAMDRAGQDSDAYVEADLDFHLSLAEAASNPLILLLINSIVGLLREQRLRIFRVPGGRERGQIHHKRILKAVQRRDPDKARHAMRAHLEQVREDFLASTTGRAPAKHKAHTTGEEQS
jgi:GntR family transcriptional repressor for pyruvate dehydrogenase complex